MATDQPVSKGQQEYRLRSPISAGVRTLRELAELRAEGLTWAQIAQRWELRPRAGPGDIKHEAYHLWGRSGSPGGPPKSNIPMGDVDARRARREATWAAIDAWLRALLSTDLPVIACRHCPHHCPGGSLE